MDIVSHQPQMRARGCNRETGRSSASTNVIQRSRPQGGWADEVPGVIREGSVHRQQRETLRLERAEPSVRAAFPGETHRRIPWAPSEQGEIAEVGVRAIFHEIARDLVAQ